MKLNTTKSYIGKIPVQLKSVGKTVSLARKQSRSLEKKTNLADPWARACCRSRRWAGSRPTARTWCSGCRRRGAWSTAPSCRPWCRTGRSYCPRGRRRGDDPRDRHRAPLRGCPPATESDSNQAGGAVFGSGILGFELSREVLCTTKGPEIIAKSTGMNENYR